MRLRFNWHSVCVTLAAASQVWAQATFTPSSASSGAGQRVAAPFFVQRVGGGPAGSATVSVDPDAGSALSFSGGTYGGWVSSLTVNFDAGATLSVPFYFRADSAGRRTITGRLDDGGGVAGADVDVSALPLEFDVESGSLVHGDTPWGPWENVAFLPGVSIAPAAGAAHRGALGLMLDDQNLATDAGGEGRLAAAWALLPSDQVFTRLWLRVTAQSPATDYFELLQLAWGLNDPNPARGPLSLSFRVPGPQLGLLGRNNGVVAGVAAAGTLAPSAGWHLIELDAIGVGSDAGVGQLWVDGVSVARLSPLDWSGERVERLQLGENGPITHAFLGTFEVDDMRVSTVPQPSTLAVQAPGVPVAQGSCVALTAQLLTSSGVAAPASYPVDLAVGWGALSGSAFADPGCTVSAAPRIPLGASQVTFGFRPEEAGAAPLRVSQIDFLPGTSAGMLSAVFVDAGTPDAGTPDAGTPDAGTPDAGTPDAGTPDAGTPDAGAPDGGAERGLGVGAHAASRVETSGWWRRC
ncbi:MAG: hypothetical protein IPJ65_37500 [Archangiaceae bacterium]|nr:hypothetical protein [Archangiaceae bacterium]